MKEKYWDIVINVNLKSIFNILKFLSKNFIKQKKGSIINISSIIALKGNIGQSNYAASKSGIIGFSKSISIEFGSKNIRSNVICPGIINTSMTKYSNWNIKNFINSNIFLKRIGRVEDISNFVIFLASDKSSYVTGQVIQIDGGL
jgi:3-oxoacyl-[acyl-carrier protein] reductase